MIGLSFTSEGGNCIAASCTLRPVGESLNKFRFAASFLNSMRQRFLSESALGEITQVRPALTPDCCHGRRSVSSGHSKYLPSPAGRNGSVPACGTVSPLNARNSADACRVPQELLLARSVNAGDNGPLRGYRFFALPERTATAIATGVLYGEDVFVLARARAPRRQGQESRSDRRGGACARAFRRKRRLPCSSRR